MRVIKVGGSLLQQGRSVAELAAALHSLQEPVALVHGGGTAVDSLQRRLGLRPSKIRGLRRTDAATLEAALMALCGSVNGHLVARLITAGVDAIGLSGVDGGLFRCRKLRLPEGDLGLVGEIVAVRSELLRSWLDAGLVPVIAPLSLGFDGQIYNVNADQAASALALALGASQLDLLSNVPGVRSQGAVIPSLTPTACQRLLQRGEIYAGMVPKVEAALAALDAGVARVRIVDPAGLETGGGTAFLAEDSFQPGAMAAASMEE